MVSDKSPLFVGGCERSGTSLVRALLGSHSDVAFLEHDIPLWRLWYRSVGHHVKGDEAQVRQFVDALLRNEKFRKSLIGREASLDDRLRDCGLTLTDLAETLGGMYAQLRNKPRWGLKVPYAEFRHDLISAAFPEASFIHVMRHPCDVAASMQSAPWVKTTLPTWVRTWRLSARQAIQRRGRPAYVVVRYEDLIREPATTVRSVADAVGLTYEPSMLDMADHPGWSGHNSFFGNMEPGVSRTAMERGASLDPADRWLVDRWTSPERRALGYKTHPPSIPLRDRARGAARLARELVGRRGT